MAERRPSEAARRVLAALVLSTRRDGHPPSIRKLCDLLGFRSPRSVQEHLARLHNLHHVHQLTDGHWAPTRLGYAEILTDASTCAAPCESGCDVVCLVGCDGGIT